MESAQSATAAARLAALKAHLATRSIITRQGPASLAVLDDRGNDVDTITCRPRPSDFDRWWFWDCEDRPVGEADDVIGAALAIVGNLTRSGIRA